MSLRASTRTTASPNTGETLQNFSAGKKKKKMMRCDCALVQWLVSVISRLQRSHTWRSRSKEGYGLNQQSFDLAADVKVHAMDPQVAANLTIGMLERDFSLVMLSERMEESLVLLAQQLCLPLHRVAVFKKNARTEGRKVHHQSLSAALFFRPLLANYHTAGMQKKNLSACFLFLQTQRELTAQQRKLLTRAQKLDVMVYNHFQRAFQKAVEDFGEQRMEKSVDELRRIKKQAGFATLTQHTHKSVQILASGQSHLLSLVCPTNIGTTRATPTATPLVVTSDGVKIWVALGCSKESIFSHYFNTKSTLVILVG